LTVSIAALVSIVSTFMSASSAVCLVGFGARHEVLSTGRTVTALKDTGNPPLPVFAFLMAHGKIQRLLVYAADTPVAT
jgi:hypothetical protein